MTNEREEIARRLASARDADIYTDAPECRATVQAAYDAMTDAIAVLEAEKRDRAGNYMRQAEGIIAAGADSPEDVDITGPVEEGEDGAWVTARVFVRRDEDEATGRRDIAMRLAVASAHDAMAGRRTALMPFQAILGSAEIVEGGAWITCRVFVAAPDASDEEGQAAEDRTRRIPPCDAVDISGRYRCPLRPEWLVLALALFGLGCSSPTAPVACERYALELDGHETWLAEDSTTYEVATKDTVLLLGTCDLADEDCICLD